MTLSLWKNNGSSNEHSDAVKIADRAGFNIPE